MSEKQTMKAVGFYKLVPLTDPESLLDVEIEKPVPQGRDILVQVKAISVNPADWRYRERKDPNDESLTILGFDVAGIVEQVGPECTLFKPGDEVYYAGSSVRQGGNSEFHLVDERIVGKKPASLNFAQAAALPLTSLTAWEALFQRLGIQKNADVNRNKNILIIGAAGGVGSIATQLAKLAGLTVIGTASRPESVQWAKNHGADYTINHKQPFAPQLQELGISSVDYIFCLNDVDQHLPGMAEVIAPQGKICSILPFEKPANLGMLFLKSVTFVWELMFTRSMFQTEDMIEQHRILNELADLVDEGKVKTTLAELLKPINAANLRQALLKSKAGNMIGKIVLEQFE